MEKETEVVQTASTNKRNIVVGEAPTTTKNHFTFKYKGMLLKRRLFFELVLQGAKKPFANAQRQLIRPIKLILHKSL